MLLIPLVHAATWPVSSDNDLDTACRQVASGDVIEIEPGTHLDIDCELASQATLRSSTAGAFAELSSVTLGPQASGSHLEDLYIHGSEGWIDAIYLAGAEGVTAANIQVQGGSGQFGLTAESGSIEIVGFRNVEPYSQGYAGIYLGWSVGHSDVLVQDCELTSTSIPIFLLDDEGQTNTFELTDCVLSASGEATNWGGLVQSVGNTDTTFRRVTFEGGTAEGEESYPGEGGAMLVAGGTTALFEDCTFEGNAAHFGGALAIEGEATVRGSRFFSNQGHGGAAIKVLPGGSLVVEDSWFLDNIGQDIDARADLHDWPIVAGIYAHDGELEVHRSVFCQNQNTASGEVSTASAVKLDGGTALLSRVVLHANDANSWGSTLGFNNAEAVLEHLSALHNRQSSVQAVESDVTLTNSVFDGDSSGLSNSLGGLGYNAWVGQLDVHAGDADFVVEDPGFEGFEQGNCDSLPYLAEHSDLIDAGHPETSDEDGSIADVGAIPYGADWGRPADEGRDQARSWFSGGCGGARLGALALLPLLLTRRRR